MTDLLIIKLGLDGHDRGAKLLKSQLSSLGLKVEYTGIRPSNEKIISDIRKYKPFVIGISIHSGSAVKLIPTLIKELTIHNFDSIPIVVGGVLSQRDKTTLTSIGIDKIFSPGSRIDDIADAILEITNNNYRPRGL